ncbi:MAG: hypothetical protein IPJ21_11475 [Sterolibacteriaceae bacterium]|nr:hypothetical protein [Sterolibacteriaceae bacterium]MBK9084476.1 hypothetical protein [Sterolibacteriaceae bacterium]
MNAKHAIGVAITIAGLFSSAAFAQSASSGFETSWLHLRESHGVGLPAATFDRSSFVAGPLANAQSASSGFETSWLHLRESHGVGLPAAKSDGTVFVAGAQCSVQRAGGYETSWLHLRETHGVGVKAGEAFAASAGVNAIC